MTNGTRFSRLFFSTVLYLSERRYRSEKLWSPPTGSLNLWSREDWCLLPRVFRVGLKRQGRPKFRWSLFFAFSLDRCDRLDLQPDLWRHELLDHEQRVRGQGLASKELRVEFAAQAMEDRQIILATQQRP